MAVHCQPREMERKAVNCMEVHSADWISILYQMVSCVRIRHRTRARASVRDVGWWKRANEYCSRHTQNDTDRKLETSFSAGNIHRMSQKRFDQKFIEKFVNESCATPLGSMKRGTLCTRVISNLRNFGHRSFALERNFSSDYVHTHTHTRSRETGFDGAWKLLLTPNWLVCRVCKKIFTVRAISALSCVSVWNEKGEFALLRCSPNAKLHLRHTFRRK